MVDYPTKLQLFILNLQSILSECIVYFRRAIVISCVNLINLLSMLIILLWIRSNFVPGLVNLMALKCFVEAFKFKNLVELHLCLKSKYMPNWWMFFQKLGIFVFIFTSDYAERRSVSGIRRFLYPILLIRFLPRTRSFFWRSCQLINVVAAVTQQTINPSVNAGPYILLKVRSICMDNATDPDKRMNQLKNEVSIFFNLVD